MVLSSLMVLQFSSIRFQVDEQLQFLIHHSQMECIRTKKLNSYMAPKKSHSYNLLKNFKKFQFEILLIVFHAGI